MNKIKVMHFVSGLVSGGVEEMLYNYCGQLDKEKYEFVIVYQHEPVKVCKEKLESVGCKTIRITGRNENFIGNIKDSIRVIREEKPNIVHSHMNLMNFCSLYAAKKEHVKVRIAHSHIAEKNKTILFNIMASICKKLAIYYATDLFACGYEAGIYMYGKKRMNDDRVRLIENAVDLDKYIIEESERQELRRKYNLCDKFVVGHVGRFTEQKNHERLLDIFVELIKHRNNAVLLLVGTGELEEKIKLKAQNLKIEKQVIFWGTTSNMREVYALMDVFVLPSLFEGFPVVSVEIQASDIPSVFSDTVASTCKITDTIEFEELTADNKKWADKIISVYSNHRKSNLDELYGKYDVKVNVKKLDEFYITSIH